MDRACISLGGAGGIGGQAGSGGAAGMAGSGGQGGTGGTPLLDAGLVADSGTPLADMAMAAADAVADAVAEDMAMVVADAVAEDMAMVAADAAPPRPAAPCGDNCPDLDFVALSGGAFSMGGLADRDDTQPAHQVNVPDFELMRTEVTVGQYRACVNAGACDAPGCDDANAAGGVIVCNYSQNRNDHPVNYVSWINARQFSTWVGARLPSESEWEFAAKSRGQNITYPWGDVAPTCNHADFHDLDQFAGNQSCGGRGTSAVCTHAAGNSAQGLCDLAGNLWEWIQDEWHGDYNGAPGDGSAWGADANNAADRVRRGGSWSNFATFLRAAYRINFGPTIRSNYIGFRLARSSPAP